MKLLKNEKETKINNIISKNGVSLIVLIISIVIIIIISSAIIMTLTNNSPVDIANETRFKSDIKNIEDKLKLYVSDLLADEDNRIPLEDLNGEITDFVDIASQYEDELYVEKGELVYIGNDTKRKEYAQELGLQTALTGFNTTAGVNSPELTGLDTSNTYYVYWTGSGTFNINESTAISGTEPAQGTWYDYSNSKWANIKTTGNGNNCYWVWIPRYAYKIPTPHTSTAQTINIKFLQGVSSEITADGSKVPSDYIVHPAFTFGTTELTGIWVAKFEASSSNQTLSEYCGGNTNSLQVRVLPSVYSWRYNKTSNMFDVCRKMESTGGTLNKTATINTDGTDNASNKVDTHLMKNMEWGAVVYLSYSVYGRTDGPVWINPNGEATYSSNLTGQAGTSADAVGTLTTDAYNTGNGPQASTTGNAYGVYDMNGGVWEYTAAGINNSSLTTHGSSIANADSRYKDMYTPSNPETQSGNYDNMANVYGDAAYETSTSSTGDTSWNQDRSMYPYDIYPWFKRGGRYSNTTFAGLTSIVYDTGNAINYIGFRPTLVVDEEL